MTRLRRLTFQAWLILCLLQPAMMDMARGQTPGNGVPLPTELDFEDGVGSVADHAAYQALSYKGNDVGRDSYLAGREFVKFIIVNPGKPDSLVYWMNTNNHRAHPRFMSHIGMDGGRRGGGRPGGGVAGQTIVRGALNFMPRLASPNGEQGLYYIDFQPNDSYSFSEIESFIASLQKFMPSLKDRIAFHPLEGNVDRYEAEKDQYAKAGIPVHFDEDLFGKITFLPLNVSESFGRLRVMGNETRSASRDIVICKQLPNQMPRVAGVISEQRQTPLSHVNLRAIQDKVPNAYLVNASQSPRIQPLIGKWVYYKVAADGFEIREASVEEVDNHFKNIRPAEAQSPPRDLSVREVQNLNKISFEDSKAYGSKASNLAVLHTLGLPEGTVPQGYAVPFYYYDEFMKFNGFYDEVKSMLADPAFQESPENQIDMLKALQKKIKKGGMPEWMLSSLQELQANFGEGTSIRCRSSTNNEDLPGFSGAGLYDSYTHKPDEGHIAKSIRQVYASLWNFRAYEEREFYRIDHFSTAMGVLVHKNFKGEKANGVAVTDDILYETTSNYYINVQIGEDLVTDSSQNSSPEEILLGWWQNDGFDIVREGTRHSDNEPLLPASHLDEMRWNLGDIHAGFKDLYKPEEGQKFAMEIEFKVTSDGNLAIKQARPWVY